MLIILDMELANFNTRPGQVATNVIIYLTDN